MIVTNQSDAVARWLEAKLGKKFVPPYFAIGILNRRRERVGAAVFNDFYARNIEMTAYGPGAFTRGVCRELADYCFIQLDCKRVTTRTEASNIYIRRVLEHFGWKQEGSLRDFYDDDDAIIYGLLKEDCRFLPC